MNDILDTFDFMEWMSTEGWHKEKNHKDFIKYVGIFPAFITATKEGLIKMY